MFKGSNTWFAIFSSIIAMAVLVLDLSMPLGVAGGVPYVGLVLLGLWSPSRRAILLLAVLGTVLTCVGYAYSPAGGISWVVLTNRGMAVFAIWTTAILLYLQQRFRDDLKTAHDELESRVAQRTAELEESKTRYRTLTESSLQGVGIIQDACVTYVNDALAKLLGYQREEMRGRNVSDFIMPDDLEMVAQRMESRSKGIVPSRFVDMHLKRKDGRGVWVEESAQAVTWNGKAAYQISIIDISERKQAEAEVMAAKEEAEQANRTKPEFLAHFSHELRTPLNAVIGFSEVMQQELFGPLGDRRYRDYAGDIRNSGEHLLALITDILDLSRIEAGQMEIEEGTFEANHIFDECVRLLRDRAAKENISIDLQLPVTAIYLRADERQLRQILLNLLSNAVKFTRPDTTIIVKAEIDNNGNLVFKVCDHGAGMTTIDIERVQEPFIRLHGVLTSSKEGTGLGLAITKRLVENHGGSLQLTSEIDVGTTATVSLPAERVINEKQLTGTAA